MLACTFVHRKFLGRTPPGKAVFRAFLGGMTRDEADVPKPMKPSSPWSAAR